MRSDMQIAFIGSGAMAEAMISGLLAQKVVTAEQIIASDPLESRRLYMQQTYAVRTTSNNIEAIQETAIAVLSVKPQVLRSLMPTLRGKIAPDTLVMSIVAGASIPSLSQGLNHAPIVRAMPNTPAQVGMGMTVWSASPEVTEAQHSYSKTILQALGEEMAVLHEYEIDRAMDVELQILKHLARDAHPTVGIIDEYCAEYKDLFKEVRNYECFKYLHLGIISTVKRKSLPEIAKVVSINSAQSLHHFISNSDWSVNKLKSRRLNKIKKVLNGKPITVVIDETGDRKKGKKTDYVARQYLGSVGKVDNGIVSVNAYGVYSHITFPLIVKVFKPQGTLKEGEEYQTKIELASEIITELIDEGFNIELVLADSLYGESSQFIKKLNEYNLVYVVAIRSNHGVWLPSTQTVRANKWCKFERTFSNQKSETRYIREIIYGKKRAITYWEITTDPETMPENSTSFVMTNLQGKLKKTLGDLYGLRTWVEYGFRQCKQELGWTYYRFTNFKDIERWWEIIFCVYTMISLNSPAFLSLNQFRQTEPNVQQSNSMNFSKHQQWNHKNGWKNALNNLRLIVQPLLLFWSIYPWLNIFPNSDLLLGFNHLISAMNGFRPFYSSG